MKSEPIIADIAQGVSIWEGVRQEIDCFGKRLIEALLKEELLSHLGRRAYERLPHSNNSLNGYYRRNPGDNLIRLEGIRVPRLRRGGYCFRTIQRYRRRTRGFDQMIVQGYLMGLSTRQVSCFFYRQIKDSVSPNVVSRLLRELDEEHSRWRHRPLGNYPYLMVDGLWVKVKVGGRRQQREIMREASHIYRAPSKVEAYHRAAGFYHRWQALEPRAVANFLQDIEKSLSYFHLPLKEPKHRSKLKTVNKLESFFRGLRRRINNMETFENIKSLERHLFALIIINKTKQDTPYMLFTQNS